MAEHFAVRRRLFLRERAHYLARRGRAAAAARRAGRLAATDAACASRLKPVPFLPTDRRALGLAAVPLLGGVAFAPAAAFLASDLMTEALTWTGRAVLLAYWATVFVSFLVVVRDRQQLRRALAAHAVPWHGRLVALVIVVVLILPVASPTQWQGALTEPAPEEWL